MQNKLANLSEELGAEPMRNKLVRRLAAGTAAVLVVLAVGYLENPEDYETPCPPNAASLPAMNVAPDCRTP